MRGFVWKTENVGAQGRVGPDTVCETRGACSHHGKGLGRSRGSVEEGGLLH